MKILVLSDTHRNLHNTKDIFENLKDAVDIVVHLGDCDDDMEFFKAKYTNLNFYGVAGNCDFLSAGPDEYDFVVNGRRIVLTHGSRQNVKGGYGGLIDLAKEKGADVCLFGHTHFPIILELDGVLLMNPGSPSMPRGVNFPSYGILDIDETGNIDAAVVGKINNVYKTLSPNKNGSFVNPL